ncbi:ABC transporter ATP-binding protein [Roseinatronobacter alkalisoli]|uniref:ABC transporter ATP-binding protein n=1 Tax=Roseinatronobacter alkalisoli TaxID=3028235 RepID=A0ABT5TFG6_9RHOB|nr:ABC transporter ATP-binding protein [Roseinatronobacter sp. HJB301]MDD7973111.1 ABC transporter ATP-binding protein [Roseinatronobacter sp. HJB301]
MTHLHAHGMTVRYGGTTVLHNVTLPALQPGSVTALIGPNAAGKSTLLRALAGLGPLAAGEVWLADTRLDGMRRRDWARHVRYVPQLFGHSAALTVLDAVLVARLAGDLHVRAAAQDRTAAAEALVEVGIAHLAERPVTDLSGGQQQLVALAMGLARPAPVLLLDEPTSALDLRRQLELLNVARRVARDRNVILIAALHDLNLAIRHADSCILMYDGRICATGTPEDVILSAHSEGVYGVRLNKAETAAGRLLVEAEL